MSIAGNWNLVMKTPIGENRAVLAIDGVDGAITGTMSSDGQSEPIKDGKLEGDALSFAADVTKPMSLTLKFDLLVTGDTLEGKGKPGVFPSFIVVGSRA